MSEEVDILMSRAATGELDAAETSRLEALCEENPELRAELEELRRMADTIRGRSQDPAGLILLSVEDGRVHIVAAFDEAFQKKGVRAGDFCRSIGKALGGGGGGKRGMAQGEGKEPEKADQAMDRAVRQVEDLVSGH